MHPLKDIVILGGGTAGLISALMLKTIFENSNVTIVKSSELGIIGVGEGSTEHWNYFEDFVGLNYLDTINNTDATVKIGILFKDWKKIGSEYLHSILGGNEKTSLGQLEIYNHSILNEPDNPYCLTKEFIYYYINNNLPADNLNFPISKQYHFDTFKLNSYLIKKCQEKNILIKDCIIKDISLDPQGDITSLISEDNEIIKGDFFIDCTGFKRVISSKLGVKWESYKEYLPMNHAITLATPLNPNEIEPYTTATALSSGWAWKIPTQTRYGNGYVFDDNYTNPDNALNEFNKHLNTNIEKVAKDIKFEAGRVDSFWVKNCVSIGLAGSFAEPLEAQSIGFTIVQTQALIEHFNSWLYDKNTSKKYNTLLKDSFDKIIDYLQIHYFSQRDDSSFWKNKSFKITEFNENTLDRFSHGKFSISDFSQNPYYMFGTDNFYQVYYGLGLINKNNLLKTYYTNSDTYNSFWHSEYIKKQYPLKSLHLKHSEYLKLIKSK
jgi:tryptophan halogenase